MRENDTERVRERKLKRMNWIIMRKNSVIEYVLHLGKIVYEKISRYILYVYIL